MAQAKLLLDTNVLINYLDGRDIDFEATLLLMTAGCVGEFALWMSSSQMTDLVYILSEGGKPAHMPGVLERLRKLRAFVSVYAPNATDVDSMLATSWRDPEDALLFEIAKAIRADAIITNNVKDFESDAIRVCNCSEFFEWMRSERGLDYELA